MDESDSCACRFGRGIETGIARVDESCMCAHWCQIERMRDIVDDGGVWRVAVEKVNTTC